MDKAPSAPRSFEIAIGLIMGAIGVGLLSLVAMLLYKLVEQSKLPDTTFLLISSSLAIVGAFCSLVSYRLVTSRGVRGGGGLLSSVGWQVLGWMFMALARGYGVRIKDLPLTPERVWRALKEKK